MATPPPSTGSSAGGGLSSAGSGGAAAAGVIGGILNMANSALNRRHQNKLNEANIKEENRRRDEDRKYALEDLAAMQHYNDPKQQMNRYRQAGLNPNLIYGKGADSTTTMARAISTSDVNMQASPSSNPAPEMLSAYLAVKQNQAQTDQVYQNIALAKAEEQLKQLSASNMAIKNAYDQNSLEQARKLNDSVILKANLENQIKSQELELNTLRNNREEIAQTKNLEATTEQILKSQQDRATQQLQNATLPLQQEKIREEIKLLQTQRDNLKQTNRLQEFELTMMRAGITKDSPWYTKFLSIQLSGGNPLTLEQVQQMQRNTGKTPIVPYKIPSRG